MTPPVLPLSSAIRACLSDFERMHTDAATLHASFFGPRGIELPEGTHDDQPAGVAAGRSGRFGMGVGVDWVGQADALRAPSAEVVVSDLTELFGRG